MAEAKKLRLGTESPAPSKAELEDRLAVLRTTVEKLMPMFPAAIAGAAKASKFLLMHQDAFAAGYDDDEYMLLGMAVKYAGLQGVELRIGGVNGETIR